MKYETRGKRATGQCYQKIVGESWLLMEETKKEDEEEDEEEEEEERNDEVGKI